jgi:hypothetical protein
MKIKKGFVVREIAGKSVVIALGEASKSFKGMIELNGTARVIWDMLSQEKEKSDIVDAIVSEYDVARETADVDIEHFIDALKGAGVLE